MKNQKRKDQCLNCNTKLSETDNFCPNCGQENHYNDFSMKELISDFFGSFINLDGKIWNSLKNIVLSPGQITKQYIEGKRIRFVPPFKLYLFFSFIYFILLNFSIKKASHSDFTQRIFSSIRKNVSSETLDISKKEYIWLKNKKSDDIKSFIDSTFSHKEQWGDIKKKNYYDLANKEAFSNFRVGILEDNFTIGDQKIVSSHKIFLDRKPEYDTIFINRSKISLTRKDLQLIYGDSKKIDSLITAKWGNVSGLDRLNIYSNIKSISVFSLGTEEQMTEHIDSESNKILSLTSNMLILMMPFVSLLLFVFFRKKYKKIYVHLVHSLHLHVATYLFSSILMGVFLWIGLNTFFWILALIIHIGLFIYFVISNKVLYQEKNGTTFLKSFLLVWIYIIVAFIFGLIGSYIRMYL